MIKINIINDVCILQTLMFKDLRYALNPFLPEASFGLRVLSLPASVCLCVCLSVCVSVNPELVRAINHDAFKLEPPNLEKKVQNNLVKVPIVLGGD